MNSYLTIAVIANTFALMCVSVSGETGTEIMPAQPLSIRLYDHAQTPSRVIHSAIDQTSWLFRAARIRISWDCPSTESPEDRGTNMTSPRFQQPDRRGYIVVRLMGSTPASFAPGTLGYALPFAHTGAHVMIFYDRVEKLARIANEATYIFLGHTIAHEIGHVLLGSSEHAAGGLMQERWTAATWRLASTGLLAFRREETELMGASVKKFQAQYLQQKDQASLASSVPRHFPE